MSDLVTYRAEHVALKKANGKLHADVHLLGQTRDTDKAVDAIRKEIGANEQRMHTLEYLMRWIREHGID